MALSITERHRPNTIEDLVGESSSILKTYLEKWNISGFPRFIILDSETGGVGKNTIARIIAASILKENAADILKDPYNRYIEIGSQEQNAETMKILTEYPENTRPKAPVSGGVAANIITIDEAHALSPVHFSKLLTLTEVDQKFPYLYIILLTNMKKELAKKAKGALLTRATQISLPSLSTRDMLELTEKVLRKEPTLVRPSEEVLSSIIKASEGSARKLIKLMEDVQGFDEDTALRIVRSNSSASQYAENGSNNNLYWLLLELFVKDDKGKRGVMLNNFYMTINPTDIHKVHKLFEIATEGMTSADSFYIAMLSVINKRLGFSGDNPRENVTNMNKSIISYLAGSAGTGKEEAWENYKLEDSLKVSSNANFKSIYERTLIFTEWLDSLPKQEFITTKPIWKSVYYVHYLKLLREHGLLL